MSQLIEESDVNAVTYPAMETSFGSDSRPKPEIATPQLPSGFHYAAP